jgi:hypothetical protein
VTAYFLGLGVGLLIGFVAGYKWAVKDERLLRDLMRAQVKRADAALAEALALNTDDFSQWTAELRDGAA